jgi:hypothetical protein
MRIFIRLFVGLAVLAILVSAAPIPISALGIDKTVTISSRPFPAGSAGGFHAIVDGFDTTAWCVDNQNFISPGAPSATYQANVIAVGAWAGGQNALVRKGTNISWTDGDDLTALQRYQGSAWIIEQYTGFPDGPSVDDTANVARQNAIWRLTHMVGGGGSAPAANADYAAAVAFLDGGSDPDFGFGRWAVISGLVDTDGDLLADTRQTFMVQYTPEPGTYALMAAGLGLLAGIRRRLA